MLFENLRLIKEVARINQMKLEIKDLTTLSEEEICELKVKSLKIAGWGLVDSTEEIFKHKYSKYYMTYVMWEFRRLGIATDIFIFAKRSGLFENKLTYVIDWDNRSSKFYSNLCLTENITVNGRESKALSLITKTPLKESA